MKAGRQGKLRKNTTHISTKICYSTHLRKSKMWIPSLHELDCLDVPVALLAREAARALCGR